jgi:hypothetical protein
MGSGVWTCPEPVRARDPMIIESEKPPKWRLFFR